MAVFAVRDLRVAFSTPTGRVEAVAGVDLSIEPGEVVALVGESGSGKTQALLAALGLSPRNAEVTGSALFEGEQLIGAPRARLDRICGSRATMIFQEPMTALDALTPIGAQIAAPLVAHSGLPRPEVRLRVAELLDQVELGAQRIRAYPHQLSGGERQRVMIAMAIANRPALLIADEPTTALDVTVQARILDLLRALQRDLGMAMIFVSHDLPLVGRLASRVVVMRGGRVLESGATRAMFAAPRDAYTRLLIEATPRGFKPAARSREPLLEARGIRVTYDRPAGLLRAPHRVRAVDVVDLTVRAGQTVGIVGESGSGKSTLARALLRLTPCEGEILFQGRDLAKLGPSAMRPLRRRLQIVFQDPFGSLSPRLSAGEIVTEGLRAHAPHYGARERDAAAVRAFEAVGLDPSERRRTPDAFSGGQRQRIAIARALMLEPALLTLDEPTSALDRSVQRDILALLRKLQDERGLAYIFITHDLAVARSVADEILVMRDGRVVERGRTADIFQRPRQTYTRELVAAADLDPAD